MDDRDCSVAVAAAKSKVAAAEARVAGLAARVAQQETAIRQAQAAVSVDDAEPKLAEANQKRYSNLSAAGSCSHPAHHQPAAHMPTRMASPPKNLSAMHEAHQQHDTLNQPHKIPKHAPTH